jgi:hypothetical protein
VVCPSCQSRNSDTAEYCSQCGRALPSVAIGSLLAGRYEIQNVLGRGGMGTVYKAHDRVLDEIVAVKILRADTAPDSDMARRFRSEIKLARKVRHPNVCAIHEYGEEGNLSYIAMEYVQGTDLREEMRIRGTLPARLQRGPGRKRSKTGPILLGVGLAGAAGVGIALAGGGPGETQPAADSITFVGSDPAPGSTITVTGPSPRLTLRARIRYGAPGTYRLLTAVEFATPNCGFTSSTQVTMVAGQDQDVSVPMFPFVTACVPGTSQALVFTLRSIDPATTLMSQRADISYSWVP